MGFLNVGKAVKEGHEASENRRRVEHRSADHADSAAAMDEASGNTERAGHLRKIASDIRSDANRKAWPSMN